MSKSSVIGGFQKIPKLKKYGNEDYESNRKKDKRQRKNHRLSNDFLDNYSTDQQYYKDDDFD